MQAYRISEWRRRYETNEKGKAATGGDTINSLRKSPLNYIRLRVFGHQLGPAYRKLVRKAWASKPMLELAAFGLFCKLLELAADQQRDFRGWILNEKQQPMNYRQIAEMLDINDAPLVKIALELLCDSDIGWVELAEFPTSPQNSAIKSGDVSGTVGEKADAYRRMLLNETETEGKVKEIKEKGDSERDSSTPEILSGDSDSDSSEPIFDANRNIQLFMLGLAELLPNRWTGSDHTTFYNIAKHITESGRNYGQTLAEIKSAIVGVKSIENVKAFVVALCKEKYGFEKTVELFKR